MPYYPVIRHFSPELRAYALPRLQALRAALAAAIPTRTATETLLLATWNLREFDTPKYGGRSELALLTIAEIAARFDLIAIQEVRDSLWALQRLQKHLGPWWDYLVTDVTLGKRGNSERLAYLYDKRKVAFSGMAAEVVLPPEAKTPQLARSPYVAGFKSGWSQINLCTVHLYYGDDTPDNPERLREIRDLAGLLAKNAGHFNSGRVRTPEGETELHENLLLLGDFNIFKTSDATFQALLAAGFKIPEGLNAIPGSNVDKNKRYDQIAYLQGLAGMAHTGRAGVFDFYEHIYRDADAAVFQPEMAKTNLKQFRTWRTYQLSDHLPMWAEFKVDDSDAYLARLAAG